MNKILVVAIGLAIVFAFSILTTIYVLQNQASENSKSHAVSNVAAVKDNLKLEMSLEKTQFTLGELVPITFVLTNESNQTLNFTDGSLQPSHFGLNFQVYYTATKNPVFSWLHGAYPISSNGTETLAPNENFTIT